MHATRFAILLVVGLCATQSLYASSIEDTWQDFVHRIEDDINKLEKQIGSIIGDVRNRMDNIPKCAQSERPKVAALINKTEQDAMECITKGMSDIQPASQKMGKIIQDMIPVVRRLVPKVIGCQARGNPIFIAICDGEAVTPEIGPITNIVDEMKKDMPEVIKMVQNDLIPLMNQCSKKFQDDMNKVQDIITDMGKCVGNKQS